MSKSIGSIERKLISKPILIFLDWKQIFHVHVDETFVALGTILAQPGEGDIDHPISFSSRKLFDIEKNYNATKREGLAMVYVLQKFRHYLLRSHFKFFTNHSTLHYLVNMLVLWGRICHWLSLFQKFEFEVVINPWKQNVGLDILSCVPIGEAGERLDDALLDAHLFKIDTIMAEFFEIVTYLMIGRTLDEWTVAQKRS